MTRDNKKSVCLNCGVATNDLARHLRRRRCVEQHIRHEKLGSGQVIKETGLDFRDFVGRLQAAKRDRDAKAVAELREERAGVLNARTNKGASV